MLSTYQVGMCVNNLSDTLSSERLLPEPPLDIVENFSVCGVVLVQDVFQAQVRLTKSVTEMLREYPSAIYENSEIRTTK